VVSIDIFLSVVLDLEAVAEADSGDGSMIARPAQYLLRFDDLCPTHARQRWQRFVPLLEEFRVKPILAIVPDNCDPGLALEEPDREFWEEMRGFQAAGAAIGLHGYRHRCASASRSLVPLHGESEFAGVPEPIQRMWIGEGLEILRAHGLDPVIWVAPRHGFDDATLRALRSERIALLSDGFARRPFLRGGLTWIPQQLWAPESRSCGLWTICLHANSASDADVEKLRGFLEEHAGQFTAVERVAAGPEPEPLDFAERIRAAAAILRIRAGKTVKGLLGRR
jgi:predicted deacetylase